MNFDKAKKYIPSKIIIIGILVCLFVFYGENSICRSVSCMRVQYKIGDDVCYYTTNSYSTLIHADKNGPYAKVYYIFKSMFDPRSFTVVTLPNNKIIGLLEADSHVPFKKDTSNEDYNCTKIL